MHALRPADAPEGPSRADAIDFLRNEYRQAEELFSAYALMVTRGAPEPTRRRLSDLICNTLEILSTLETEVFYPAVRGALLNPAPVATALADHATLRTLVGRLRLADPAHAEYDERVARLGRQFSAHGRFEEHAVFAPLRRSAVALHELGAALGRRQQRLQAAQSQR